MQSKEEAKSRGMIAWFVYNPVAANLLMIVLIVAGLMSALTIKKRMFPDFEINNVLVEVEYLGASPGDIEEGVLVLLEESLRDITGISKVVSEAREGYGQLQIELESGFDIDQLYNDVKTAIEGVTNLPDAAEDPRVTLFEQNEQLLYISLYGDLDRLSLQRLAQSLQDKLMTLPDVLNTNILGENQVEVSILISEKALQRYNLTFDEVAAALRATSVDIPAGTIRSSQGDIAIKTRGQLRKGFDFNSVEIRSNPDGSRLLLSDVATIHDGFSENDHLVRFNGKPAIAIEVVSETEQNDIKAAKAVRELIKNQQKSLPEGVSVKVWSDMSHYLQGRIDMMLENILTGALLVFIMLSLFLRIRVALWVIVGIPVCFLGALWLMPNPLVPVSLNMLSLFGFILVLGIVVDDAIIIGESVYSQIGEYGHGKEQVIAGVNRVVVPATFGVLTTMAVFLPLLLVEGMGKPFFTAIAVVVILCLMFSLVESKMILPAHLANIKHFDDNTRKKGFVTRIQDKVTEALFQFVRERYAPMMEKAIEFRYITLSIFLALLILLVGLINSPLLRSSFFPEVPSEFIMVQLEMEAGSATEQRNEALISIENSLIEVDRKYQQEHDQQLLEGVMVWTMDDLSGTIFVELTKEDVRSLSPKEVTRLWRESVGDQTGVRLLNFSSGQHAGGTKPIYFQLTSANPKQLEQAADALERQLGQYAGLFDIENGAQGTVEELVIDMLPSASALGVDLSLVGNQVRQGIFGEEVQRFQRGREEVTVYLRYPEEERDDPADLANINIRNRDGVEIPFYQVARIQKQQSPSVIRRTDGERSIAVSSDLDTGQTSSETVVSDIMNNFAPQLRSNFPDVSIDVGGATKEEVKTMEQLMQLTLAALLMVYVLIAIPLKSYLQPVIVMGIIPFGLIGALIGHILLNIQFSMMSIFGLIALAGVLVNDSLLLVDRINQKTAEGVPLREAAVESGCARFRAIILTSLTTFLGLVPIALETSLQAQFVIPMAVSLGFGILFATAITLVLTPILYLIINDASEQLRKLLGREARSV